MKEFNKNIKLIHTEDEVWKYDKDGNQINISYRLHFDFYGEDAACVVDREGLNKGDGRHMCMAEGAGSLHDSFVNMVESDAKMIQFIKEQCDEIDKDQQEFDEELAALRSKKEIV